jgi:hypothetical protein
MVEKVVQETFSALFAFIDLREILRETKPTYLLNREQKKRVGAIIEQIKKSLDVIEKELG